MPAWLAAVRAWWARLVWDAGLPLGARGEKAAAKYLRRRGYRIVARGVRSALGEIDLVALDGQVIVFVEVKTRESAEVGHPSEAVHPAKQRKLTRLALGFLKQHRLLEHSARFDVIAVTWPESQRRPTIEHYPNAFEPTGWDSFYS